MTYEQREIFFAAAMLDLADALGEVGAEQRLERLTAHCQALTPVSAATALVIEGGDRQVWAATPPDVSDGLTGGDSWESGSPLRDCHRLGRPIPEVPLAHPYARACWPRYAPAARDSGFLGVAAWPLSHDGTAYGALCLLSQRPGQLGSETERIASALARATAIGLAHHQALAEHQRLAGQLQRALDSRTVIEQAKGILAERHDIPLQEAFEMMRRTSRSHQTPMRELAQTIIATPRRRSAAPPSTATPPPLTRDKAD
ncbi:ANTAR domain-containing response regulator [Streptomyces sp. NPDC001415]